MQYVDEKDKRIKQLEDENKKLLEKVEQLEHNVDALTQAILHAAKQRFGASSEKTPQTEGQSSLFGDEFTNNVTLTDSNIITIKEHKRPIPIRKKGDRAKLTERLPREVVECVLNPEEAICDICESEMKIIGKKKVRSEIEYIPAKLVMKDYVQYVYKCTECGTSDEYPDDVICSAVVPAPVLKHSVASPSIVAWIMYQKYKLSVPLYRQEEYFQRLFSQSDNRAKQMTKMIVLN